MKNKLALLLALFLGTIAVAALTGNKPYYTAALTATTVRVSATPAYLTGYNLDNTSNTAVTYVQVFDAAATTDVNLGTTAPTMVLSIPAGAVLDGPQVPSIAFQSGIVIAATTTRTGSTAPATSIGATLLTQ